MHQMKLFRSFLKSINILLNTIVIFLIKGYKLTLSPLLPSSCRFSPTCSSYALSAYKKYSFFIATFLTLKRILRCNPLFKGGYDPLPENFNFSRKIDQGE